MPSWLTNTSAAAALLVLLIVVAVIVFCVCRKQSKAKIGAVTADAEGFYRTVRLCRKTECAAAFAAACNFEAEDKPLDFRNRLRAYAAGGYTKLVNGTAEQRAMLLSAMDGAARLGKA